MSTAPRVIVALESAPRFEAMHVAQTLQLLAWDDVTAQVRRALERTADRHVRVDQGG